MNHHSIFWFCCGTAPMIRPQKFLTLLYGESTSLLWTLFEEVTFHSKSLCSVWYLLYERHKSCWVSFTWQGIKHLKVKSIFFSIEREPSLGLSKGKLIFFYFYQIYYQFICYCNKCLLKGLLSLCKMLVQIKNTNWMPKT